MPDVHSFVAEERAEFESIVDSGDYGDLEDVVRVLHNRADPVAVGMLYLGEVEAAGDWFAAIADGFVGRATSALADSQDSTTLYAGSRPWRDC